MAAVVAWAAIAALAVYKLHRRPTATAGTAQQDTADVEGTDLDGTVQPNALAGKPRTASAVPEITPGIKADT